MVKVMLEVPQGIIDFLKENAFTLATWDGTEEVRSPEQHLERAIQEDFQATLDAMGLNAEMVFAKYNIPQPEEGEGKELLLPQRGTQD